MLDAITAQFFRTRIFTPGRMALLAAQLPASDADAATRRDKQAAALAIQIRKLDAQQDAQVRALEDVPAFDLAILWNKEDWQATVTVTISDETLAALPEILDPDQPGYHDTTAADPTRPLGY